MSKYKFTEEGRSKAEIFILECNAKRNKILDAGIDTADETMLPTLDGILCDIECFVDPDGDYYNCWGVTDNYNSDTPLSLTLNEDFIITEE